MEPHLERMQIQQEQIQLLPSLIEAVTVREQSAEALPAATYQCVDRLLADMEHLEDRIEALNEIMDAQRQRVTKNGVDLKMVMLPPDITTSITAFDISDMDEDVKMEEVLSFSTRIARPPFFYSITISMDFITAGRVDQKKEAGLERPFRIPSEPVENQRAPGRNGNAGQQRRQDGRFGTESHGAPASIRSDIALRSGHHC